MAISVLAIAFIAFIFYPAFGDRIALVVGWNRVIFLAFSFLICGAVYFLNYKFPAILHKPLALTAEISFGLYLFHPIVYFFFIKKTPELIKDLNPNLLVLGIALLAYIFSYLAFRFIELPVVNFGKILTENLKNGASTKKHGENPFI